MRPLTIYIVATDFSRLGIGAAGGDIYAAWSQAYDAYAESLGDCQPARAFVLEFDVETNALECGREVLAKIEGAAQ